MLADNNAPIHYQSDVCYILSFWFSIGRPGWGISWYINDTLIPELVVERNRTYTFLIYGGDNPADGANYHPFYITDSENGGRLLNTQEQRIVSLTRLHDML